MAGAGWIDDYLIIGFGFNKDEPIQTNSVQFYINGQFVASKYLDPAKHGTKELIFLDQLLQSQYVHIYWDDNRKVYHIYGKNLK